MPKSTRKSVIVDTGKRPERYPYAFSALLSLPQRLMNPPSAGVEKSSSLAIKPAFKLNLDDVLNAKHLPPLGLSEFQDFLMYTEYSVENLHFFRWFKDYSTAYTPYHLSEVKDAKLAQKLRASYARAKQTFLTPYASYELNLPGTTLDAFNNNIAPVEGTTPPPPEVFAEVRGQVERMLKESLVKFVTVNCGNAGRNRGLFAIVAGTLTVLLGLISILLSFLPATAPNYSRWIRASAFVPFWLGLSILLAGLHGVCVIIYLFGDARQLYPYELARPAISAPKQIPISALTTSESTGASETALMATKDGQLQVPTLEVGSINDSQTDVSVQEKDDVPSDKETHLSPSPKPARTSKPLSPSSFAFDFDALMPTTPPAADPNGSFWGGEKSPLGSFFSRSPSPGSDRSSRAMWGPLTKVTSPIVTRAQWEIFIRSMLIGFVFGLVMCIILIPL